MEKTQDIVWKDDESAGLKAKSSGGVFSLCALAKKMGRERCLVWEGT